MDRILLSSSAGARTKLGRPYLDLSFDVIDLSALASVATGEGVRNVTMLAQGRLDGTALLDGEGEEVILHFQIMCKQLHDICKQIGYISS